VLNISLTYVKHNIFNLPFVRHSKVPGHRDAPTFSKRAKIEIFRGNSSETIFKWVILDRITSRPVIY
jgi:hypothetical protein